MPSFYLVPLLQQTITIGNQQVTANLPKYVTTDLAGIAFSCMPFGLESLGIVGVPEDIPSLDAEDDTYAFPVDLTTVLADSDVSDLQGYLPAYNVPSDWIVSGSTFQSVLIQIAQIFLCVQFIDGQTGQSLFANGVTPSTSIAQANSAIGAATNNATNRIAPAPPILAATTSGSLFDFSQVDSSASIGFHS
jgi:hypothetical protein